MVALSPSRLARRYMERGGLAAFRPPVEMPGFTVSLYWSRRLNSDPGAMWLKALFAQVCEDNPVFEP